MANKPKVTIIDGNNEIELSTIEDNVKAFMVKGEPGEDAVSPTITSERDGKVTTLTITDKDGTKEADINDGFDPVVEVSKANRVTTIAITDFHGTAIAEIPDGIDLTGGVPTDGVIGFDEDEIIYTCDGTETGDYYLTYNNVDYYFTMPTVDDGDVLVFNTTDLTLKLGTTTISTSSTGTGTELTFDIYIPNGYEVFSDGIATQTDLATKQDTLVSGTNIKTINNTSLLGSGDITISGANINDSYSTSTTEAYSANYINNLNTYSENEIRVGTWINGKPIYRKVIAYTPTQTIGVAGTMTQIDIQHNIANLGYVINAETKMFNNDNSTGNIPNFGGSSTVSSSTSINLITSTYIRIRIINDTWGATRTWYFILEYLKTTD